MLKSLTGGALISYGGALPDPTTAFDGQLFYKTVGSDQGLYVFSFTQDANTGLPGDQSTQQWNLVESAGVFVAKIGDTMAGALEVPGYLRITATSGHQRLLLGNQDTSGANKPGIIDVANGILTLGSGTSWLTNGGTLSPGLTIDTSSSTGLRWLGTNVWTAGNDGAGSGLDADVLDGHDSAYFTNAGNLTGTVPVGVLPFTPVQQGGGTNQGTNKLYVGWTTSASKLQLQVDSTDYGSTWPISISGNATTASFASSATNATTAGAISGMIAYSSLPFTPIEQGGGTNQGTNKVHIGWTASASKLQLQVDGTDYGSTWPISISGNAATTTQVSYASGRTDSVNFPVLWGAGPGGDPLHGTLTQLYSCATVTINSNTGTLAANNVSAGVGMSINGSPAVSVNDLSNNSLGANGYQRFPGQLVLQWGEHVSTADAETITFPITFPHACLNVVVTVVGASGSSNVNPQVQSLGPSTFQIYGQGNERHTFWQAIGY